MQPLPLRLSQAIQSAFKASRPIHRSFATTQARNLPRLGRIPLRPCFRPEGPVKANIRWFADQKDVDKKVEDAKSRIDDTIKARVEAIKAVEPEPKPDHDVQGETIIHTNPESSSFVHKSEPSRADPRPKQTDYRDDQRLPSDISSSTSHVSKRFSHIMDNLQSNIFVASRRLNDLTGYSGIEALKDEISRQEELVHCARRAVKDTRAAYAAAVATRSATQREVNDLLHRKHAWSPTDLERFTNLYRSDHANEGAETAAQQELSRAESAYEEASTKLARTILARYHEEQIWSDKIRQMSTWGTWGLMGLNVLLFVLFQIAIEPWRRRRLVKGFEDKVQEALAVQQRRHEEHRAQIAGGAGAVRVGGPEAAAGGVAGNLVNLVVDSITGASDVEELEQEAAIEQVVASDPQEEDEATVKEFVKPATSSGGLAYYQEAFREKFGEKSVVVTQRELTTVAIEGAAAGAAVMGLLLVLLRPR